MAEVLPSQADLFDERGMIATDVMCRRCGYNLRGLHAEGRCPECGTPVGRSTLGDLLQYSDPQWLEGLARGANLILWGVLTAIVAGLSVVVLTATGAPPAIASILEVMGYLLGWYGTWLLTEPDPSRIGEDEYGRARRIVRVTLLIGVLGQILISVQENAPIGGPVLTLLLASGVVAGFIGLIGWYYQLVYLERFAKRFPAESLAKRARTLRWLLVVLFGIGMLLGATGAFVGATAGGPGAGGTGFSGLVGALLCISGVIMLASLIALFFYVRMIWQFRSAFREKAAEARQIWQAG